MPTESTRAVRLRAFIDSWYVAVVVLLVVLTVVAGWWAYQVAVVPDIEHEQRTVEQWAESTEFEHSARITTDSVPFSAGERVTNRPIYYTNLANNLDGSYSYEYSGDDGSLAVSTDTYLLIRAGELDGQEMTEVYWEVTRPLESQSTNSLAPDESHSVDFVVDINSVLSTIETVEQQVGSTEGLVDVRVVSVSAVDGTAGSQTVDQQHESELVLIVEPEIFRVIGQNTVSERHQEFQTVETIQPPSVVEQLVSLGLFGVALIALVAVVVGRSRGRFELSEDERELLAIEQSRERFSEWITTGTFPSEREYEQTVLVDDLEGLIDVAIDTNKRVIEDQQLGVSTVLDDTYIYIYIRPDSPARDWLVSYADSGDEGFNEFDHGF